MAGDPFLSDPTKKRKRASRITSSVKKSKKPVASNETAGSDISSGSDEPGATSSEDEERYEREDGDISSEEEFQEESAADKRRRLAKQYLQNLKAQEIGDGDYDAADLDEDILARRLQEDVAENRGKIYKFYGQKIEKQLADLSVSSTRIASKNITAMAVKHPYIYTVSKDMELIKWKDTARGKPRKVKFCRGGSRYVKLNRSNPSANHHFDHIYCVAASPDGKYVVTGGKDARLIIWSGENLSCLKVLETRAAVNSITFRRGTDQLYAACADLRIRTFSINQFAQLEILYGHQDNITDISALSRETCVSVGSRDKTAMYWKISEESRLTFRAGDSERKHKAKANESEDIAKHNEGSTDFVSMIDETHFVTGSDNGNLSLWSLAKKKALFTQRLSHGLLPQLEPSQASAETETALAGRQIPERQPYWITAVHGVPYSDLFLTGSYSGEIKLWSIEKEGFRSFSLVGSVPVKGCVVEIASAEVQDDNKLVVYVAVSKEHKFGRWLGKIGGRNALMSVTFHI